MDHQDSIYSPQWRSVCTFQWAEFMGRVFNSCMCYQENKIFNEMRNIKPIPYFGYVNNIYLLLENKALVHSLQEHLKVFLY